MTTLVRTLRSLLRRRARRVTLTEVDPQGPVFVSYRHSDGRDLAVGIAWALRAAGVPVWQDETDLPPGDTNERLREALAAGLSGAVLLVSPELEHSEVIREIELPELLRLEQDPRFTLSVASVVETEPGKLDYKAPDRLLRQRSGTLQRLNQQPASTAEDRARLARAHCRQRVRHLRPTIEEAGSKLTLDVQTRVPPSAARLDADLVLRLRPPREGERRPGPEALEDLRHFLGDLPDLLARGGAEQLRVRGGAHLTVAFALGAALPTTLIGRVTVRDTSGGDWSLDGAAPAPTGHPTLLQPAAPPEGLNGDSSVLVYLDLLPTRSDGAYVALRDAVSGQHAAALHLRPASPGPLDVGDATRLVGEAAHLVRDFAGVHDTSDVHLLLRTPYPVALLLGRSLNTLRAHLYEWEEQPDPSGTSASPRYLPALIVRSGAGGSPIEAVTAT